MAIAIMLITGIAGAGMYVMKLRADNATLKSNQLKLETAIEDQTKLLEQQKADFKAIMESNKKLNVLVQTFKQDLNELDKRFNKKKLIKSKTCSFILKSYLKSSHNYFHLKVFL